MALTINSMLMDSNLQLGGHPPDKLVVTLGHLEAVVFHSPPTSLGQLVDRPALALWKAFELGVGWPGPGDDRCTSALLERLGGG
jgi:hypothetical protein